MMIKRQLWMGGLSVMLVLLSVTSVPAGVIRVPQDFATIQAALDSATYGDTILVAPGKYGENIVLKKGIVLQGSGAEVTHLEAPDTASAVIGADGAIIDGFTISGGKSWGIIADSAMTISHNIITSPSGVLCQNCSPCLKGNTITTKDVAILCDNASPLIERNILVSFSVPISCSKSSPRIINNTIFSKGAIGVVASDSTFIKNNIIATYTQIGILGTNPPIAPPLIIKYNLVFTGPWQTDREVIPQATSLFANVPEGVGIPTSVNFKGDSTDAFGNLFENPRFVNHGGLEQLLGDFRLLPDSPAIDAGDPDDPWDPDDTVVDLGALPFEAPVTIVQTDENSRQPQTYRLYQNFPNPFNPCTTIEFFLPKEQRVTLSIYNLLGQRVKILLDENYKAGSHRVVWDGTDESGALVTSGIYIYQLSVGILTINRKMLFLH
ncbi:MAG: T9SS type A sorting domain-containing protein [candidate division KSB1 bacterium]|nr:T9SS type A sorting domain-containing protein [candidate division KSB1 bacterium]